jgi:hypothetical protein
MQRDPYFKKQTSKQKTQKAQNPLLWATEKTVIGFEAG